MVSLTAYGCGGGDHADAIGTPPDGSTTAPTLTLSTDVSSLVLGAPVKLKWSSTSTTSCTASGAWNGPQATSGEGSQKPTSVGQATYTLTCTGPNGSVSKDVSITVTG